MKELLTNMESFEIHDLCSLNASFLSYEAKELQPDVALKVKMPFEYVSIQSGSAC